MADMLDVIHFMVEDDLLRSVVMAENPAQAASDFRSEIYREVYRRPYRSALGGASAVSAADPEVSAPATREIKPYIPPTMPTDAPVN